MSAESSEHHYPTAGLPAQDPRVRKTLPEHFRTKELHTDSAGIPWEGRDYSVSPFPEDRGERDPRVQEALDRLDSGADASRAGIVSALRSSRVLIPIQAIATDTAVTASGLHADNASDMAMVKIQAPSGDVALPIFTSVEALLAWNPEARPVPLVIEQAAQSAVAEGCTQLLVDAGRENTILVSRSALWAIAQGREWVPPFEDQLVQKAVSDIAQAIPSVDSANIQACESREAELVLVLQPGLSRESVQVVLRDVQALLARSEVIAERVSSLKISLR